jgi:hypothetical protein
LVSRVPRTAMVDISKIDLIEIEGRLDDNSSNNAGIHFALSILLTGKWGCVWRGGQLIKHFSPP